MNQRLQTRAAFTLVELLVVVSIVLILAIVTVSAVNLTIDGDRVRSGARQVQSYLAGARDRAIYSKEQRGVRFLLDATDSRTVTSMVYITPTDNWTEGTVRLERPDGNNNGTPAFSEPADPLNFVAGDADEVWVLRGFDGDSGPGSVQTRDTNWKDLYNRGLLQTGNRIQIPAETGAWYTVDTRLLPGSDPSDNNPPVRLLLQQAYRDPADNPATSSNPIPAFQDQLLPGSTFLKYKLELLPAPMPNQEPVQLPKGTVIHLDRCGSNPDGLDGSGRPTYRGDKLPPSWRVQLTSPPAAPLPNFVYSNQCDIMFSPRGTVTGSAASAGIIHLYIGDQKDSDQDHLLDWQQPPPAPAPGVSWSAPEYAAGFTATVPSGTPYQRRDKTVVSIFTRTGAIQASPIYTDATGTTPAGQRFRYSETGEVAGK